MQFFFAGQVLIHQHTDGNSQGLGSYISSHVQDQGLETHNDRQNRHNSLKDTDYRRHAHTHK